MGQYFIPTIFRKEANIKELYTRYDEDKQSFTPSDEKPVAALLSHHFKIRYKMQDGRTFSSFIGLKFAEHCYIGNPLCRAVEYLLATKYAGCPVVWAGDYSKYQMFSVPQSNEQDAPATAYSMGDKVTSKTYAELPTRRKYNRWNRFLINHDTEEYVVIPRCKGDEYQPHPLPLLTCDSHTNHFDDNPLVGIWKGHHLSVSNERPLLPYRELKFDYTVKD